MPQREELEQLLAEEEALLAELEAQQQQGGGWAQTMGATLPLSVATNPGAYVDAARSAGRRAGEFVTEDLPQFARDMTTVPAKMLAGDVAGLVGQKGPQITPDDDAAFRDQMINLLMMGGGAKLGGAADKLIGGYLKTLARGGRRKVAVAREAGIDYPSEPGTARAIGDVLLGRGAVMGTGAAAASTIPEALPTDIPAYDEAAVGGLAAVGAGPMMSREVLLTNPKTLEWAISKSKGNVGKLIGALLGAGAGTMIGGDR